MDSLLQDFRYALRTLRRAPGYTIVVVLTLALGIAANTTVFSVLNPYLLRPLPYAEADRLVQIGQVDPVSGWDGMRFSLQQLDDWRARSRAFEDIAAYHYGSRNLTGDEGAERVMVGYVTGNLFPLLGARPALGRTILPSDDEPGPPGRRARPRPLAAPLRADPGSSGARSGSTAGLHGVGVMSRSSTSHGTRSGWVPCGWTGRGRRAGRHHIRRPSRDGWTRERASGAGRDPASWRNSIPTPRVATRGLGQAAARALNFATTSSERLHHPPCRRGRGAADRVCDVAGSCWPGRVPLARIASADGSARGAAGSHGRCWRRAPCALAGGVVACGWRGSRSARSGRGCRIAHRVGTATLDSRVLFSAALTLVTPILFGLSPRSRPRANLASSMGRAAGAEWTQGRGGRRVPSSPGRARGRLVASAGSWSQLRGGEPPRPGLRRRAAPHGRVAPPADYPTVGDRAFFQRARTRSPLSPACARSATAWLAPTTRTLFHSRRLSAGAPVRVAHRDSGASRPALRGDGDPLVAGRDFGPIDGPDAPPSIVPLSRRTPLAGDVPSARPAPRGVDEPVTIVGVVGTSGMGIVEASRPQLYRR